MTQPLPIHDKLEDSDKLEDNDKCVVMQVTYHTDDRENIHESKHKCKNGDSIIADNYDGLYFIYGDGFIDLIDEPLLFVLPTGTYYMIVKRSNKFMFMKYETRTVITRNYMNNHSSAKRILQEINCFAKNHEISVDDVKFIEWDYSFMEKRQNTIIKKTLRENMEFFDRVSGEK